MNWIVLFTAVYSRTDLRWHDFPVLESETSPGDFFYYHRPVNQFFIGKDNQTSQGFGASTKGTVPSAPSPADDNTWISTFRDEPYKDVLDKWFQYDYVKQKNLLVPETEKFKNSQVGLHCLRDEIQMRPCSSGSFTFTQPYTYESVNTGAKIDITIPGVHSFQIMPDTFVNLRPVYQRVGGASNPVYLFYHGMWYLGRNYNWRVGYAYVNDSALSPEYIMGEWTVDRRNVFKVSKTNVFIFVNFGGHFLVAIY